MVEDPVVLPRDQWPPKLKDREWDEFYTTDITTAAGVRQTTYDYLGSQTASLGNDALSRVIGSELFRRGCLTMDALEQDGDVEEMKRFGREWLQQLLNVAQGGMHVWSA